MPIFEYKCKQCGAEFEQIVLREKADDVACEECGGETERQLSVFGVAAPAAQSAPGGCPRAGSSGCQGGSCPMAQ